MKKRRILPIHAENAGIFAIPGTSAAGNHKNTESQCDFSLLPPPGRDPDRLPSAGVAGSGGTERLPFTFLRRIDRAALEFTYAPQFASGLDGTRTPETEISRDVIDYTWEVAPSKTACRGPRNFNATGG